MVLDAEGTLDYKPGDHVGIIPSNRTELVNTILSRISLEHRAQVDEYFHVEKLANKDSSNKTWKKEERFPKFTMRQALTNFIDITTPIKQHIMSCLVEQATNINDKEKIQALAKVSKSFSWFPL